MSNESKLDEILQYDVLARMHGETRHIVKANIKELVNDLIARAEKTTFGKTEDKWTKLKRLVKEL